MKYYIHKTTNELLATIGNAMGELHTNVVSETHPAIGITSCVFQLCVFPNRQCPNGVPFQAIDFRELSNFKRISKSKFFELCPDFGQYRHFNDKTLADVNEYHELLSIRNREKSFGI